MNIITVEECQRLSISQIDISGVWASVITINGQTVQLSYSRCNFGGKRAWFLCPKCNKQVGVLYRKPLNSLFYCRSCQDLCYELTKYRRSNYESLLKLLHATNRTIWKEIKRL